jgi:hypothetical protein
MRHLGSVLGIMLALSVHAFGQAGSYSQSWNGTWNLDMVKSTFGPILFPGAPPNMTIVAQRVKIERSDGNIRFSGETTVSLSGKTVSSKDDTSLSLDGIATAVGPAKLAFRPIDATAFEIISSGILQDKEYQEVSRFVFSKDGSSLTETKTQTERAISPTGGDKGKAEPTKSSISILIFRRAS